MYTYQIYHLNYYKIKQINLYIHKCYSSLESPLRDIPRPIVRLECRIHNGCVIRI